MSTNTPDPNDPNDPSNTPGPVPPVPSSMTPIPATLNVTPLFLKGSWWTSMKAKAGAYQLMQRMLPGVRYSVAEVDGFLAQANVLPSHRAAAIKFLRTGWDYPIICRKGRHLTEYWIDPTPQEAEEYQEQRATEMLSGLVSISHAMKTVPVSLAATTGLTMAAIAVGAQLGLTAQEVMARL